MMTRRAIPLQADRITQALAEDARASQRERRALPPHLDGDGELKTRVEVGSATTKTISHGLGRKPRGVQVLSFGATAVTGYPELDASSSTTVVMRNRSASTATFDLWIY